MEFINENEDGFAAYTKCMLAVDLYKNKKVSLGYCASIADMTKEEMVQKFSLTYTPMGYTINLENTQRVKYPMQACWVFDSAAVAKCTHKHARLVHCFA